VTVPDGGSGKKPGGGSGKPPVDKPPVDKPPVDPVDKPPVDKPPVDKPPVDKPPVDKPPVAKGEGTLLLGAKPPCEIFIDGRNTGLKTPQRDLKLSAGKHKITLLNNEFGIKESFSIEIKPDEQTKVTKDFSDRLPQ
jgi:hypothetical protein